MNAADLMGETGDTTLPGQDTGDTADTGAGKAEGAGAQDAGGGEPEELETKGKVPPEIQEKIDRRIGKLTAKQKSAEERATAAEAELQKLRAEREEADAAKYAHLPVAAEFFEGDELQTIEAADRDAERAEQAAEAWGRYAASEDGYTDKQDRTYTPAQCAKYAADAAKLAGRAEGKKDLILARAQQRQREALRELREARARPKPGAGAPGVAAAPKPRIEPPEGDTGAPKGGAPARPADTLPGGGASATVPKSQDDAKAWLNG